MKQALHNRNTFLLERGISTLQILQDIKHCICNKELPIKMSDNFMYCMLECIIKWTMILNFELDITN